MARMWHSEAGGRVVMVLLLERGCSVRGVDSEMMARGDAVSFSLSGCWR